MGVEEIIAFEFICSPMEPFPIRSCTLIIYARDLHEANELFLKHAHEFFDRDINTMMRERLKGYRQTGG